MTRRRRVRSEILGVAALLGASLLPRPASASENFPTNVRPYFSVGPSFPAEFDWLSRGFGMGFGFEAEQSRRLSALFRVELSFLRGEPQPTAPYDPVTTRDLTSVDWSLGARAYLGTHGPIRSYVDGAVGVRLVSGEDLGVFPAPGGTPASRAKPEGMAVTLRLGLSSASPRRAGFTLDTGLEFLAENPGRYGLATLRLGIVFP